MIKLFNFSFAAYPNWIILQTLLISTIFTTFSGSIILSNTKAYANGNIREDEVKKYAQIVIKMEKPRQQAYDKIKKIFGNNNKIPNIVCNDQNNFGGLPRNAKDIAENYCERSREIVKSHDLTIGRFNEITEAAKNDNKIQRQIYNALIKEQGGRKNR